MKKSQVLSPFFILILISSVYIGYSQEVSFVSNIDSLTPAKNITKVFSDTTVASTNNWFHEDLIDKVETTNGQEGITNNSVSSAFIETSAGADWADGGPENMFDKYTLKPSPGSFANNMPALSENLLRGKVNVTIPLFTFSYYGFKIPVFLANDYPQVLGQSYGEPVFYLNSNVGGDWSLPITQYKVSRQVNGVEDEHPSKGYFSSVSQSKLNNPGSITHSDVKTGLRGDWDPAIDVFHFSTPTVSGSFIFDISTGQAKILSGSNVKISMIERYDEIYTFYIIDENGIEYWFGGDDSAIEVSQSITDIYSFGKYLSNSGKVPLKAVFEVIGDSGQINSEVILTNQGNLFGPDWTLNGPSLPPDTNQVLNDIRSSGSIYSSPVPLPLLGSKWDDNVGQFRNYYGLPNDSYNNAYLLMDSKVNDPDLKREKTNAGWYLKQIRLLNGKKINFRYNNDNWKAYQTVNSNKIEIDRFKTRYTDASSGFTAVLDKAEIHGCMPLDFQSLKFPINESHIITTHFVKKPELIKVFDDDQFSKIYINKGVSTAGIDRPYMVDASAYENAPAETLSNPKAHYLLNNIRFDSHTETINVDLKNSVIYGIVTDENGTQFRDPIRDRSQLNEILINDSKKYTIQYRDSRLHKIHYPTGGYKEFFSTNVGKGKVFYEFAKNSYGGFGANKYSYIYARADSVITISERNTTVEEFKYPGGYYNGEVYNTFKTFRADIPCISSARMYSTSPIYGGLYTKGGFFTRAEKYVNGELRTALEFESANSSNWQTNTFYLTNNTTPDYLNYVGRPKTLFEEKMGLPKKTTEYKTLANNTQKELSTSEFQWDIQATALDYPSLYLSKIEAGPWQDTNGAIKRGYSLYYLPFDYQTNWVKQTNSQFFDNSDPVVTENTSYFKRYRHSTGVNNHRLIKSETKDSKGDIWTTEVNSVFEVENLLEEINAQNSVFSNMLQRNMLPPLESLTYKNGVLKSAVAYRYDLDPVNGGIPLLDRIKTLETTSSDVANFSKQSLDPITKKVTYDTRLKDKIIYDRYEEGNLIEYHLPKGTYTSIVWGYKNQFPIAKLQNAHYSQVQPFVDNLKNKSLFSMSDLKTAQDDLRENMNASLVSSYTYKGISGLESETKPSGQTLYYKYNDLFDLESIKDVNQNILEHYTYSYKTLSNYSLNFKISDIQWINPSNRVQVGSRLHCTINPSGGSGNYSYGWTLRKGGTPLISGSTKIASIDLVDASFGGEIELSFDVTDNETGIAYNKKRRFYVYQYGENVHTLHYDNIVENQTVSGGYKSQATVTSPMTDTLKFWAFNRSAVASEVTVTINNQSHTIGYYQTKTIEVPVQAGQTITCEIFGSNEGSSNAVDLEIFKSVNGTFDVVDPKKLSLIR